eukprot:jgi/Botrbrau1/17122/Bobra.0157s0023.1
MAKWGEGDPRWLVEQRDDGKNVSGWHWEEKNRMKWSREKLQQLVSDLELAFDSDTRVQITGLKDLSGEAYLTMRKGNKKAAIYDLELAFSWAGRWAGTDATDEVLGQIKVGDFSVTSTREEWTMEVTADGDGQAAGKLQEAVRTLKEPLFNRLDKFIEELQNS